MRLKALTTQGIRGFNAQQTIEFSDALTLIDGANGTGKTSLGEALEWLLYGMTFKREKGDGINKPEYKGSYRNLHWDGQGKPFAEARVVTAEGDEHVLRRELNEDESSQSYLDGSACDDFSGLGVISEFDRPLILQHTLQDFIHMAPKKRYRALSSILGLEGLVKLRDDVGKLQGTAGYAKEKPRRAAEARTFLEKLQKEASRDEKAEHFEELLRNGGAESLSRARTALLGFAVETLGSDVGEERVSGALRAERTRQGKAILDWEKHLIADDVDKIAAAAKEGVAVAAKQARELVGQVEGPEDGPGDEASEDTVEFFKLGLKLRAGADPNACPFCGEKTLTVERVREMEQEAKRATGVGKRSALARTHAMLETGIADSLRSWMGVLPKAPGREDQSRLQSVLDGSAEAELAEFRASIESVEEQQAAVQAERARVDRAVKHLGERIQGIIPEDDCSTDVPGLLDGLPSQVAGALAVSRAYSRAYDALTPSVQRRIATQHDVQWLDFLIKAWEGWPSVEIGTHDRQVEVCLLGFRRKVTEFIKAKQIEILQTKQQEIRQWYSEMNAEEAVGFSHIDVATDELRLIAESYGEKMAAAPNLSCSHLNCVGLAVYLACATRPDAPFGFLMIDDPVQSMDEGHAQAFQKNVLRRLLRDGAQVIVLTHLPRFADQIDVVCRGEWDVHCIRLIDYSKDGPIIEEGGPRLAALVREARGNMDALNEAYRGGGVQCLRMSVERFVKDLYVRGTDMPISRRYARKSWRDLKKLLRACPSFEPSDESVLEAIHVFTSSHMHEDDSVPQSVPGSHQIRPHVSEMERLLEKYGDVLGL